MKLKVFIVASFLSLFFTKVNSQELPGDIPKIFYRNEKTLGLHANTNGVGIGYRYGDRINYFEKRNYEFDFSIIKHPKEIKSSSSFIASESFVFGKLNYVFDLHLGYGKQNEMFAKRDPGSVAVRYFYSTGLAVAFLKPVYYEVLYPLNDSVYGVREEKFNPDIHTPGEISGKSSFFKGFDEIKLVPGAYLKAGINFEFSQSETIIHALEAGVMFQAYLSSIEIMAVDDNQQFFFTLFISYRIGKIINAQEISSEYLKKRKKKIKIFNWM
ncbi:MAG: hypothetical protein KOO66_02445 [Bacteroidales bacterium]|nr:hypothetical protein [Bacteroidales bacterium]